MSKSTTSFPPMNETIIAQVNDILIKQGRIEVTPRLSVVQPQIKLVDASLAYKYADLENDASQMTSYATAFLGITIAAIISLAVSYFVEKSAISVAIYSTTFILSAIVTLIFSLLAKQASKKAQDARHLLEASADTGDD